MIDLKELRTKIKEILGTKDFILDTGEQSYNVYPTTHIHLMNGLYSVNVGHIIYGNITVYDDVLERLSNIHDYCKQASESISDYVQVYYLPEEDAPFRVVFGGLGDYDQESFDYDNVNDLLEKLITFEFNL